MENKQKKWIEQHPIYWLIIQKAGNAVSFIIKVYIVIRLFKVLGN